MAVRRHEIFLLEEGRGGQEQVRRLGGIGEELIEADYEVEPGQRGLDGRRVGHLVHEVALDE